MRENRTVSAPPVGLCSLLTIFSVLCLTTFALLSLSTVRANERLGEYAAAAVSEYYAADAHAEEILSRLRGGELPRFVMQEGDVYRYSCPISDTQVLAVEVRLDGAEYQILRWQAVPAAEWQVNDALPVWNGEMD